MKTNFTHTLRKPLAILVCIVASMAFSSFAFADEKSDKSNKIAKSIKQARAEMDALRDELREEYRELGSVYKAEVIARAEAERKRELEITTASSDFPFDLKYKGIIEITEDNKMITGISADGFVEINKTAFGNNRRLFIHADDKGTITYEYYVGKTETAFNPEGKKWLAEILPDIVKRSDLGVESRVRHLYQKKGLRAVLDAIEDLPSGSSYTY